MLDIFLNVSLILMFCFNYWVCLSSGIKRSVNLLIEHMALDAIGINIIAITAIISIIFRTQAFFRSHFLLLGIIAFVGTVAFLSF